MANIKNNAATQETCRKLIEAAGEVFASQGLHAATIKEITTRAGVNCAAINYHYRDKFELYAEVVRHALYLLQQSPQDELDSPEAEKLSPEERLALLISHMFKDIGSASRPPWCDTILTHEFAQPTAALDAVMDELIQPRTNRLRRIVREILGPKASEKQIQYAALSVVSQCVMYLYNRVLIRRLHPQVLESGDWDEVAKHVTEFSLHALHAMRRK